MSAGFTAERRNGPRVSLEEGIECRLELRTRVRLLDISVSGALLGAEVKLPVGTHAHLRSAIATTAFSPDLQVRRLADASGRNAAVGLGAAFTAMDERTQRSLEEFLRKANT
jgi:c-di-GMP-binding flagellar brake protein YcgR